MSGERGREDLTVHIMPRVVRASTGDGERAMVESREAEGVGEKRVSRVCGELLGRTQAHDSLLTVKWPTYLPPFTSRNLLRQGSF